MDELNTISQTAGESYAYTKRIIENEAELIKLKAIERSSIALSRLIFRFFIVSFCLIFLILGSVTAAIAIGESMESLIAGFSIVTGFYLLVILVALLARNTIKLKIADDMVAILHGGPND